MYIYIIFIYIILHNYGLYIRIYINYTNILGLVKTVYIFRPIFSTLFEKFWKKVGKLLSYYSSLVKTEITPL